MKKLSLIEINQPAGSFFLGKICSKDLFDVFEIGRIRDGRGPQRDANNEKIKKIENYCKTDDRVTFPTPIIVNVISDTNSTLEKPPLSELYIFNYDENNVKFRIIDGQHRLLGVKKSAIEIEFPIVVMFDLSPEDEAYVFTTINHNQTKVDKSQIYQLFELSDKRSPKKLCHEIARTMNSLESSPFFMKIKMLGRKMNSTETLSQAAFVDGLLAFFPNDAKKDTLLASFYNEEKDDVILKILMNYFNAVKKIFPEDWNDISANLTKTTGYLALCKAFPEIFEKGVLKKDLSQDFFAEHFKHVQFFFEQHGFKFNSNDFPAGGNGQKKLSEAFLLRINS